MAGGWKRVHLWDGCMFSSWPTIRTVDEERPSYLQIRKQRVLTIRSTKSERQLQLLWLSGCQKLLLLWLLMRQLWFADSNIWRLYHELSVTKWCTGPIVQLETFRGDMQRESVEIADENSVLRRRFASSSLDEWNEADYFVVRASRLILWSFIWRCERGNASRSGFVIIWCASILHVAGVQWN